MNKVLKITLIILGCASMVALLGFVGTMHSGAACDDVIVQYTDKNAVSMVSEADVEKALLTVHGKIEGQLLDELDVRSMESAVVEIPYIAHARVYKTIDRNLIVELKERNPIARLIDGAGNSALLDTDGFLIPVHREIPLRLPVVSGHFAIHRDGLQKGYHASDSIADPELMDVLSYARKITADDFWEVQFQYTEYAENGDFTVYPQVGNHKIILGNINGMETKLERLKIFYKEGLSGSNWNKYSSINLKYNDQIVCTKK